MYYYNQIQSKFGVYSLDMIRLNFDSGDSTGELSKYFNKLDAFDMRCRVDYYPSYSQYRYRHLWTVTDMTLDVSWSVGLDLGVNTDSHTQGFVEFNPNKCMHSDLFTEFWTLFKEWTYCKRDLVRYDLAIDIPYRRDLCKIIRSDQRHYRFEIENGVTEYLGCRNRVGYTKLYDKTKESGLDYDLSRLEITLGRDDFASDYFPKVYLYDAQMKIVDMGDLNTTQQALVMLLRAYDNPNAVLHRINFRLRKKLEPYLCDRVLILDSYSASLIRKQALNFESIVTLGN